MASSLWAGAVVALVALPAALGLPRDPGGTLERVRGGELPVAVTAPLTPTESAALERLAADLGARLVLLDLPLHEAVAQLATGTVDGLAVEVVAGAIPRDSPHIAEAAATRPLGRERHVLLLRQGENGFLLAANRAVGAVEDARRGEAP